MTKSVSHYASLCVVGLLTLYFVLLIFSGLFIDVGTNYSVLDHTNLSFVYEDVLSPGPNADGEFVSNFIVEFVSKIKKVY